jgi:WD40 repeat protein
MAFVLRGHNDTQVRALAVSADGRYLASGGYWDAPEWRNVSVCVWEVATKKLVRRLELEVNVFSLTFLKADVLLISSLSGARVFHVESGRLGKTVANANWAVESAADGSTFAIAVPNRGIAVHDARTCARLKELKTGSFVNCIGYAGNGEFVALGCNDGRIRLYGCADWRERLAHAELHPALPHFATGRDFSLALAPRHGVVVSGMINDPMLRVWRLPSGAPAYQLQLCDKNQRRVTDGLPVGVQAVALTDDERTAVVVCSDKKIRLVNLTPGATAHICEECPGVPISVVILSKLRRFVTAGYKDYRCRVWSLESGRLCETRSFRSAGYELPVEVVARSHDETILALGMEVRKKTADGYEAIRLLDASSLQTLQVLSGPQQRIRALAFSPDKRMLASIGGEGNVCLWDVATGFLLACVNTGEHRGEAVSFSPDGHCFAIGGESGCVSVWEVSTCQRRYAFPAHEREVGWVSWAPDQRQLFSAGLSGTVLAWDLRAITRGPKANASHPVRVQSLWEGLAAETAEQGEEAVRLAVLHADDFLGYIKGVVKPVPRLAREELTELIKQLDAEEYSAREAATQKLASLGPPIASQLRQEMLRPIGAEHRRRINALLTGFRPPNYDPDSHAH